ncbi:hypothetical protein [Streptomyces sp. NPDC005989]|uniref:hypothetical protein n=1 Tax=Streptomyces sp. NPDC005989 TaxID=3156727 RepID=UPI0033C89263
MVVPPQGQAAPPAVPAKPAVIELKNVDQVAAALAEHLSEDDLTALTELLLKRLASKPKS